MSAEDRKVAIVTAALPLFARKGFAETTTKELAKAAGVSEPLLYRHFPSKEALYAEIQEYSCRTADPILKRLMTMEPSTGTLVQLIYWLVRAMVVGKPTGLVEWKMRHRLMLSSLLEDGDFARLLYQTRFESFCHRIELCLEAAIAAGDAVAAPITSGNRARFAHHVAAWVAVVHLPAKPAIQYRVALPELVNQVIWFALRGMGLTDRALAEQYHPEKLAAVFAETSETEPLTSRSR